MDRQKLFRSPLQDAQFKSMSSLENYKLACIKQVNNSEASITT